MATEYRFKVEKREVPPYSPLSCLSKAVLIMSALAFIGLATWIIMAIIARV